MIRKKIVYIVSDIEKSLAFEWTARELSKNHDLFFLLIGKNNTPFSKFLTESQIEYTVVDDKVIPSFFRKWIKVFTIIKKLKPDIVHIHLWRAMLLGLTTSWLLRIKKRIFTRHHGTLHHTNL